jgi:hypothetical protein
MIFSAEQTMDQGYEMLVEQTETVQEEQPIVDLAPALLDRVGGGVVLFIL